MNPTRVAETADLPTEPADPLERHTAKRTRHRRRRAKLYLAWREQMKTSGDPHRAYAVAKRVVADRRRRKARRAARQALRR